MKKRMPREGAKRFRSGQALIEYLLMTSMLLFLFVGLYRLLQSELTRAFERMGRAILHAYY